MRPVPRSRHLLAVLIFTAVAAGFAYVAMIDDNLSESQINIASAAARRHDKDLFPNDPVFGESNLWLFHTPVFQALMDFFLIPTGYADLTLPFRLMTGFTVLLYLCGMYALLYRQCRSWSLSAFVAVLSCKIAWTIGWSHWGVGSLASISPSTLVQAFVPAVVLMYLHYHDTWRVLLVFLVIGLLGNLHLITAMNLTLVLLGVYVGYRRFRFSSLAMGLGCLLASLLGALLYVVYYFVIRSQLSQGAAGVSAQGLYDAFEAAGLETLYPAILRSLLKWLPWVAVLAIPAGVVLSRVERFRVRDLGVWVWFIITATFVAFGLQGISQLVGLLTDKAPIIVDFAQCAAFLMLPMYALFAQAMTNLFRLVRRRRALLRWACAVFLVIWLAPSDNLRYLRHQFYDFATSGMDPTSRPRKVQRLAERRSEAREMRAIAQWALENTPINAVFMTGNIEFRMRSRRSIVASADDIRYVYYLTPGRLQQWTKTVRELDGVLSPRSGQVNPEDLRTFRDKMITHRQFRNSGPWYAILHTKVSSDDPALLERIDRDGWGRIYRVYALR